MADSNKQVDATPYLTTLQGGTGTTTAPSSGQVLFSSGGTTYTPTTLNTLDVKGASYSADAPSSPFVGQVWIESDTDSDSFDPNIIRRKSFTATAGQTTFTTDLEFIQGYEQVFFNGMLLVRNNDYTTTNNTTVVLTTAAAVNDVVEVVTITNLNSINAATTTANTFTGNQIVNARIGIGASSPDAKLTVQESGDAQITLKNSSGATRAFIGTAGIVGSASTDDLRIRSDASNMIFAFSGFEKMRFSSSGSSVFGGIATGTPPSTSKVYVNNGSNENIGNPTWGGALVINEYSNTLNANMGIEFKTRADGNGSGWRLSSLANNPDFVFESRSSSATWTERMRINSDGNMSFRTVNSTSSVRKISRVDDNLTTDLANISMFGSGANNFNGVITFNVKNGGFFDSALAEVMRISSDGRVGIAMGTPRAALEVGGSILTVWDNASIGTMFADGSGYFLGIQTQVSPRFTDLVAKYADNGAIRFISGASIERARFESTNGYMLVGYTSSNGAYRLQVNSQIFATSSSIATSDGRYKENVNTITSGLDIVDSLRPVSFTWKDHPVHNFVAGKTVGFIAQEVKESLSQYDWIDNIIKTNTSDAILDEEGNEVTPAEEFLGIAESNIIPLLVAAVKELKARVETLEAN